MCICISLHAAYFYNITYCIFMYHHTLSMYVTSHMHALLVINHTTFTPQSCVQHCNPAYSFGIRHTSFMTPLIVDLPCIECGPCDWSSIISIMKNAVRKDRYTSHWMLCLLKCCILLSLQSLPVFDGCLYFTMEL